MKLSKLFKIKAEFQVKDIYVFDRESSVSEWNGRDSDRLHSVRDKAVYIYKYKHSTYEIGYKTYTFISSSCDKEINVEPDKWGTTKDKEFKRAINLTVPIQVEHEEEGMKDHPPVNGASVVPLGVCKWATKKEERKIFNEFCKIRNSEVGRFGRGY